MAITDLYDDGIDAPHLVDIIAAEAPPPGRALAEIKQEDLIKLSALNFSPITARNCEVERKQAKVLMRIKEDAAMGGSEFFYSFPVKKKGGGVDYIEGISIDGAMATMQAYGNCEVDCRPIDIGHAWIFLARFVDLERGTSLIKPFLQRKQGGSRMGGDDEGRRLEIAFNIGASKATRNVIANAIRPYTNFCFAEAKNDLVKRVGHKLKEHKDRVVTRLAEFGVDLKRVEALQGRTLADWTAREVAGVLTQISAIRQGLAVPNDVWPVPMDEPKRSDEPTAAATPTVSTTPPDTSGGSAGGDPPKSPPAPNPERATEALRRAAEKNTGQS
jgi:hypothetical protein